MFKSSRLVYYPFADSSLFLTITFILGFFTPLSYVKFTGMCLAGVYIFRIKSCVTTPSQWFLRCCLGRCFSAAGQNNSIVSSRLLFSRNMGNLYVLLRYSLILGLLTRRINRYVCGRVFMIERCVPPSQWALLCQRSCCLGDYVCHRVKQVHCVKQALGDSKSLLLRRLNPASQLCFA